MSRRSPCLQILLCLILAVAAGCTPQQPFYLGDDGDLSHYKGIATELEVPDVDVAALPEVCGASQPLSLSNAEDAEIWNLSLEESVRYALDNSKVMRNLGVSLAAPEALTRAADAVATVYDPARVETNPRYGTEAALSAFDTQFTTSLFWENTDVPLNRLSSIYFSNVDRHDLGTFQSQLTKTNATGGTTSIGYNVFYDFDRASPTGTAFGPRWSSDWNVDVTAEFRQPLFQGAGVQFNRIAGPGAIPGYNNGVIIARIQTDIALADFENSVRTFVLHVEQAYWNLYLMYRELDAVVAGRDSALETWRRIKALQVQGSKGGDASQEAQAREQYWLFVAQVEQRLSDVFTAEAQLRYMMGLAVADGRQIRPADEPTPAKVSFDWRESMCEALVRNVDLRRQKWRVKEKELELISAKNFLLPRLDAVGQYRWRGLGNDFWSASQSGQPFNTAMQSLTNGNYQDWQFGMEFSLPIGFRKQLAGVRHAQLNLARERSLLREQQLEVSHQLGTAIRDLDLGVRLIRTNYEYYVAAKYEVAAVRAAYETGTITLNVLLDAQRRAADAEIAYYRSLVNYNLAIIDVHYRKGSLLEYNGIWLAEGPWVGKAYFDAHRRAVARDAGLYMDYGFTRPKVISQGAYQQQALQSGCTSGGCQFMQTPQQVEAIPAGELFPEQIITPSPDASGALPLPEANESSRSARSARGPKLTDSKTPEPAVNQTETGKIAKATAMTPEQAFDGGVSPVRPASHNVEVTAADDGSDSTKLKAAPMPASTGWKRANRSSSIQATRATSNESDSHTTSAQSTGTTSGWKRM